MELQNAIHLHEAENKLRIVSDLQGDDGGVKVKALASELYLFEQSLPMRELDRLKRRCSVLEVEMKRG